MQAIQVKYLGPTNHRGSRLKASCSAGSVVVSWDYELSDEDNQCAAATALIVKLGWLRPDYPTLIGPGQLPDGSSVFVLRSDTVAA